MVMVGSRSFSPRHTACASRRATPVLPAAFILLLYALPLQAQFQHLPVPEELEELALNSTEAEEVFEGKRKYLPKSYFPYDLEQYANEAMLTWVNQYRNRYNETRYIEQVNNYLDSISDKMLFLTKKVQGKNFPDPAFDRCRMLLQSDFSSKFPKSWTSTTTTTAVALLHVVATTSHQQEQQQLAEQEEYQDPLRTEITSSENATAAMKNGGQNQAPGSTSFSSASSRVFHTAALVFNLIRGFLGVFISVSSTLVSFLTSFVLEVESPSTTSTQNSTTTRGNNLDLQGQTPVLEAASLSAFQTEQDEIEWCRRYVREKNNPKSPRPLQTPNLRGSKRTMRRTTLNETVSVSLFFLCGLLVWLWVFCCTTYFTKVPVHALKKKVGEKSSSGITTSSSSSSKNGDHRDRVTSRGGAVKMKAGTGSSSKSRGGGNNSSGILSGPPPVRPRILTNADQQRTAAGAGISTTTSAVVLPPPRPAVINSSSSSSTSVVISLQEQEDDEHNRRVENTDSLLATPSAASSRRAINEVVLSTSTNLVHPGRTAIASSFSASNNMSRNSNEKKTKTANYTTTAPLSSTTFSDSLFEAVDEDDEFEADQFDDEDMSATASLLLQQDILSDDDELESPSVYSQRRGRVVIED
ncbi:unnamed protein product [Amoebophrya sp. A120]|nr:unnamed protein product [Amoebophrya sp. A120]|eukprot:GSA120T00019375001.1